MKLVVGIISLVVGLILLIMGVSTNNSTTAQLSSLLSGNGTNPGTPLIIIGVILMIVGAILAIFHFVSQKKNN